MPNLFTRIFALTALCAAPLAHAQLGTVYEGHLAIQSRNNGAINTRGLSIPNDVIGGEYGLHPHGVHLIAGDPNFYTAHRAKFTADIDSSIPDKNFTGIIVLDYEAWWPNWEWTATNITKAWETYIRTQRPELLAGHLQAEEMGIIKNAYLAETRKYYEFTVNLCRQLRPKARVSVYGIPLGTYWLFNGGTQFGIDLARYKEIHEVDLAWYFDLVDVVCPTIYQAYPVKTPPGPGQFEPSGPTAHILGLVGVAVNAAKGKPVYPFMQFRYHFASAVGATFMTTESLDLCLRLPRQAGAKGIFIWDFFYTDTEVAEWQNYYDNFARNILSTTLSNGNTGGPGGTGGTNPPGPDPIDPGTNPGTNPDPGTNPGTNPGGGGPDPTDYFGGEPGTTNPEPSGGAGTHDDGSTQATSGSSASGSGGGSGGGGGGSGGGGGGSSGGGGG
ncbi:MAG: hypothetical protein JNK16_00280, partial [Phycisphaerales bacterium]|nr:hypothetical protein [Phycisphaerales bacterium]